MQVCFYGLRVGSHGVSKGVTLGYDPWPQSKTILGIFKAQRLESKKNEEKPGKREGALLAGCSPLSDESALSSGSHGIKNLFGSVSNNVCTVANVVRHPVYGSASFK